MPRGNPNAIGNPQPHNGARTSRAERMIRGMDVALKNQEDFLSALPDNVMQVLATSLLDQAKGIFVEKSYTNKKGETKTNIYQKEPSPAACRLLMEFLDVGSRSNALLNYMKAQYTQQEIDSKLAKVRADNITSQTLLNNENAAVFKKMIITQEDYEEGILGIGSHAIQVIQRTTRQEMMRVCSSEELYQEWVRKFVQSMLDAGKGIIRAEGERLLVAGDEEEEDGE